jgi:lipoprotein signal peptidase
MQQQGTSLDASAHAVRKFSGQQAVVWYLAIAGLVAMADWLSKTLAVGYLTDHSVLFGNRFALMLVYNMGAAGGLSWGPHTWLINVGLTTFAVLTISVIVTHLAKIDTRAAVALGLVAGGAVGNLASMLGGPPGVADFLALRLGGRAVVCNVADLALWSGALMLVPVVRSLMRAIRLERAARSQPVASFLEA